MPVIVGSSRRRALGRWRILVASPDPTVRAHIRRAIEKGPDAWVLCAERCDTASALESVALLEPDVVVLDVASGSTAAESPSFEGFVGSGSRRSQVLVLGAAGSETLVAEALRAGVKGIVSLPDLEDLLEPALEAVTRGKPFFSSEATEILLGRVLEGGDRARAHASSRYLTRREREVVRLFAEGQSTREVASRLCISVKTAENHRANAMHKLGVRQVSELVRQAIQRGIIP